MSRSNLVGLLPSELEDLAVSLGASRYRGRQLATWIYRKSARELDALTDLPKDLRAQLAETHEIGLPELERTTPSQDGSRKLVFRLADDRRVSAVLMPDDGRITLCLSTQVGCGYACAFCLTGTMGLDRNLTAGEIVGQLLAANELLGEHERVTHVVFMGMGSRWPTTPVSSPRCGSWSIPSWDWPTHRGGSRSPRSASSRVSRSWDARISR